MSAAVRLSGHLASTGTFCVPSASMPGELWTVIYQGSALMHCFCPAFTLRGQCRHTEAVALAVELEARQAPTPQRRTAAAERLNQIEREFA